MGLLSADSEIVTSSSYSTKASGTTSTVKHCSATDDENTI